MGGCGSGSWSRWRKSTVEESTTLPMTHLRKRLFPGASGTLSWRWTSGRTASIGYSVTWNGGTPTVTLQYRLRDQEDVRLPVQLQTTRTQFGGCRWWFTCPLSARGLACNRRAAKLYLPPGAKLFGCRRCHALTYQSCQDSHRAARFITRLGFPAELAPALAARLLGKG